MTTIRVKHGSEEWLALRRRYVCSSDVAVILGCGFEKPTLAELVAEKAGLAERPQIDSRRFRVAHAAEVIMRKEAELDLGMKLDATKDRVFVDEKLGLLASLDGRAPVKKRRLIVEFKTVRSLDYRDEWDGSTVPQRTVAQAHVAMRCAKAEECLVVAWVDWEPKPPVALSFNAEFFEHMMVEVRRFQKWVLAARVDPGFVKSIPLTGADCEWLSRMYPPKEIPVAERDDDPELHLTASEWNMARQVRLADEKEEKALQAKLRALLGDRALVRCNELLIKRHKSNALAVETVKEG